MNGVQIRIRGKVQGVGFRPFVWQLARAQARCGDVCNDGDGVLVRLVGGDDGFTAALADHCPPLARIDSTACIPYRWAATPQDFTIRESGAGRMRTQIVPDAATCPACLAEMNDPRGRRYRYPFINCTHCGPRLTIIRAMPYDRPFTAMAPFPLCSPCEAEFRDPADRRFHAQPVEQENASTRWRVDPRFVGPSYVLGDLATHPLFLVETMAPQLKITRLMCARQSFVKSRAPLEDNAHVLMEYDNGAIGSLWSSAVNCGSMHGQKVRIIGEKASLEWWDEQPNQLRYEIQGEPVRILERGMDYLDPLARQDDRIGGGHPEGLFEAWSNLYRRFAIAMDAADRRDEALQAGFWSPDARAGAFGVRWVENCVRSADNGACWVDFR